MFKFKLTPHLILLGCILVMGSGRVRAADPDWPRQIDAPEATIVLYQPQPETFHGNILTARIAVAVTPKGETTPVYGTVWTTSRIETDRDQRRVTIADLTVTRMKFPESTAQKERTVTRILQTEAPKWNLTFSLDQLEASLENTRIEKASASGLKTSPPRIRFAHEPAILVSIDGAPQLRPVEHSTLQRVVNTPYPLIYDPKAETYYLNGGKLWYRASTIKGSWTSIDAPPDAVAAVVPKNQGDATDSSLGSGLPPRIFVATEPTELIVTDGPPQYASITGTDLLYMTNTESDVVLEINSQQYYVLLSGRWFRSRSFEGPWSFVPPDQLPASFQMIPPRSPRGDVRAHVAGTDEAKIAVVDSQIPQTATIPRGPANLSVSYDGPPRFKPVPGTQIEYAVNTSTSVLRIHDRFYACDQGAWYVALTPTGPWTVATAVPPEVQTIPPSCPLYNVRYVYVYEYTPRVVYVGYTPAYLGCYPWDGVVVWGTGYYYSPWVATCFYPRPATWGFFARYHSWCGWSFGFSYGSGPFFEAFGWGDGHRRFDHDGWWGPGGFRGRHYANVYSANYYLDRPRFSAFEGGRSLYRRESRLRDLRAHRPLSDVGYRATPRYADTVIAHRNGDVYRRTEGGWDRRDRSGWRASYSGGFGRPARAEDRVYASSNARRFPSASEASYDRGREFSPFGAGRSGSATTRDSFRHPLESDYRAREMGRSLERTYRSQGYGGRGGRGGGGGRTGGGGRGGGGRGGRGR